MPTARLALALGLVLGLLFLAVSAAFAEPMTAAPTAPVAVAKAPPPAPPPLKAEVVPAKAPAPASPATGIKLAQLTYPVPTTAAAQDLLRAAEDYNTYGDPASYRSYLQQIISSYPGTKEAGQALALLADQYGSSSDPADVARASELNAALEGYSDPEVQAFAGLVRGCLPALRAKEFPTVEQSLTAYAQSWRGTDTGRWAALRLGDLYRFSLLDYPKSIAAFRQLIADSPGSPAAEKAQVALAENLNWSELGTKQECRENLEQVLAVTTDPGVQVRALYDLGEVLWVMGEPTEAMRLLTHLIDSYPTHPGLPQARAVRCAVAVSQGNGDVALADARAFLASPSQNNYSRARSHQVVAQEAYRRGDLAEAEAEYTQFEELAAQLAPDEIEEMIERARKGLAACAVAKGDLRGGMQLYVSAADAAQTARTKAIDLFQAAGLAQQLNDQATRSQIISRMVAECPGSHLTTRLVGHEVLPTPEI